VKIAASCMTAAFLAVAFTAYGADSDTKTSKTPAATAPPSMQREKLEEISATITSVDAATRMIALKADDGTTGSYEVGPEVKNFAQIKVGDKVVVSYYRGLAAEVLPPGTVVSKEVQQVDLATTAMAGEKPAAGVGSAVKATVVVQKIDTKANTVTITRPDGTSKTLPVLSDEGKAFIRKLKTGDKVDVVYAEAVAVEVRTK
jgi:Cu/Ag efflux protein CusF